MANPSDIESVREYFNQHKSEIIERFNAAGAGIGKKDASDEDYIIVVYLDTKDKLPTKSVVLDEIPVVFEVTGRFELQN